MREWLIEQTRAPLLEHDPGIGDVSLRTLVGIATAVEEESGRRYGRLAAHMSARGEAATAAAFQAMRDEELHHLDAVERWAERLGEPVPESERFLWLLPAELASSWEEVAGSARLSPYAAFAIAAINERRAFALYSYLAAHAQDATVARQAETLALEELRHAALMRQWRRRAARHERRMERRVPAFETIEQWQAWLSGAEAEVTRRLGDIAQQLREVGDESAAELVERIARGAASASSAGPVATGRSIPLLVAAQAPLETLADALETLLRRVDGALFAAVELALRDVVKKLARIGLEVARRSQEHAVS
jgi:rubrerythrin